MFKQTLFVLAVLILTSGCSVKKAAYTAAGGAIGAGVGYSIHKDSKETVIGGLGGALTGSVVADIQEHQEKKKYKSGYEEGYNQAQVDIAVNNWEENTGKNANQTGPVKGLSQFKVPKQEQDGIVYDEHYVILEDYR